MRPIDADMGREKLWEIYNAWNLAMAPAEGREIAYVDKKMRLCELMIKFLDQLPTITPPPNDPLTLEELRGMDGEPVWISPVKENGKVPERWMLVSGYNANKDIYLFAPSCNITQGYDGKSYGKTWLAYRRKPEEGTV